MAQTAIECGGISLPIQLHVRSIAPEDAAAVAELSEQLGYLVSVAQVEQRIQALMSHPESDAAFVACYGAEVVGWIEVAVAHHLQSPPHSLITGLVVKGGVRSMGVGKRLCAEVEVWSRSHGITLLRVTSRMTRDRARQFYLREGFQQTKTSAVFEKVLP